MGFPRLVNAAALGAAGLLALAAGPAHTEESPQTPEQQWRTLVEAGVRAHRKSDQADAEKQFTAALRLAEKLEPQDIRLAETLTWLASTYRHLHRYKDAGPLYERALKLKEKVLGPEDPAVARAWDNYGLFCLESGKKDEAEKAFTQAYAILEKTRGPEHRDTAICLANLAGLYRSKGDRKKAEEYYQRAVKILEKSPESEHALGKTLMRLGSLLGSEGRFTEARGCCERALPLLEKSRTPQHEDVAVCLGNLALILTGLKEYDKALPLFQRALDLLTGILGKEDREVLGLTKQYAAALRKAGREAEADKVEGQDKERLRKLESDWDMIMFSPFAPGGAIP